MFKINETRKDWLLIGGAALIALVLVVALRWRDDILQTTLNPKTPYQVYQPPPAPDYAQRTAWALLPATPGVWSTGDPPADVFFVHPTTFSGGKDWNGPIDDARANRFLNRVIVPNYAGAFSRVGRLFAPHYRQASVYAAQSSNEDARQARQFAYGDVRAAFDFYLTHFNRGRPIVLAGVEQGGTLAARLARDELAADPGLKARLAAVYLINAAVPRDDYGESSALPACARKGEPGCVMGWVQAYELDQDASRRIRRRSLIWSPDGALDNIGDRPLLCVNPLLGAASPAPAPAKLNLGASAATDLEWGVRPALFSRQVSAQCIDGLLRVSEPRSPQLKSGYGWPDQMMTPGYNLFYADVEADAQSRVAGLINRPGFQRLAPPIESSVDVRTIPVHRAG